MIKRILQKFIKAIQIILIILSLTIIYFVIFGITVIFMIIFRRKILTGQNRYDNTFWIEAKEYELNNEDIFSQS